MTPAAKSPYAGYRFPGEVISHAVWLYFRFPLSLRMVEEMLAARGRGFGLEDSQITRTDRLDRLVLVLSLALHWAVSTGMWDAVENRTPAEKRPRERSAGMLPAA